MGYFYKNPKLNRGGKKFKIAEAVTVLYSVCFDSLARLTRQQRIFE
jgi:hypothetical protein